MTDNQKMEKRMLITDILGFIRDEDISWCLFSIARQYVFHGDETFSNDDVRDYLRMDEVATNRQMLVRLYHKLFGVQMDGD